MMKLSSLIVSLNIFIHFSANHSVQDSAIHEVLSYPCKPDFGPATATLASLHEDLSYPCKPDYGPVVP